MFPSYRKSHSRSQLTALQQDGQMIFSMWSIAGAVSHSGHRSWMSWVGHPSHPLTLAEGRTTSPGLHLVQCVGVSDGIGRPGLQNAEPVLNNCAAMKGIAFPRAAGGVAAPVVCSSGGLPWLPSAGASWGSTSASLDEGIMRRITVGSMVKRKQSKRSFTESLNRYKLAACTRLVQRPREFRATQPLPFPDRR